MSDDENFPELSDYNKRNQADPSQFGAALLKRIRQVAGRITQRVREVVGDQPDWIEDITRGMSDGRT